MPRHHSVSPICIACRLRFEVCVCASAPRLSIATRLVLVIHASEWSKATNTGHLTRLAINNVDVRLQGMPHRPVSSDGIDMGSPSTLVLFPGRGARPLTRELVASLTPPVTVLVPDGNWNQSKNMMRRVTMLHHARPVRLSEPALELPAVRRNFYEDRRSTFEAVTRALGILEGPETEQALLAFYRQVLSRRRAGQWRPEGTARDT